MIGLDTNILVRIIVVDDIRQAEVAREFVRERCTPEKPGFVNLLVICELIWTLDRIYQFDRRDIARAIEFLLGQQNLVIEQRGHVMSALHQLQRQGTDPADMLIAGLNRVNGCDTTATFDRKAAKLEGFTLVR
jgi:predicted nucleic-acid-binding protein